MSENGKIFTIEKDDEIAEFAEQYFNKAGLENSITLMVGEAIEQIKTLDYKFDIVFIDADKKEYADYYDVAFEKIAKGGFILVDNVLWSGKVIENLDVDDLDTKAIVAFNKKIQEDEQVENVLFPVRDGLMVIRKK